MQLYLLGSNIAIRKLLFKTLEALEYLIKFNYPRRFKKYDYEFKINVITTLMTRYFT